MAALLTKQKEMRRFDENSSPSNSVTVAKRRRRRRIKNIHLPDEIISEILLRSPAKSVVRFRSVCKSWRLLSSTPLFVESHAGRARTKLIFQHLYSGSNQFDLYKIDDHMIKEIPIVTPTEIVEEPNDLCLLGSCDGLLLFQEYGFCIYPEIYHVLNIATKEWIAIPEPRGQGITREIPTVPPAIYFHPSTGEYRLLSIYRKGVWCGFEVFSPGRESRSWRQIDFDPSASSSSYVMDIFDNLVAKDIDEQDVVVVCGRVHWPWPPYDDDRSWLLAFDVESEKFRKILLPQPVLHEKETYKYCNKLIDMGGSSLGLCRITSTVMELWLLKENAKEEEWIKQHTILTNNFVRPPDVGTFSPLAFWSDDNEILIKWDNDDIFVYNLDSKLCRDVIPIDFLTCHRPHLLRRVALLKETLRDHKI